MKFSVDEPLRLIRKLHGLNPKTKTFFRITLKSEQIEFLPPGAKPGKEANTFLIEGEGKEAINQLINILKYQSDVRVKIELISTNRIGNLGHKTIVLTEDSTLWPKPVTQATDVTSGFKCLLPFMAPVNISWKVAVHFGGQAQHSDYLWLSAEEMRRILQNQPRVAYNIETLRQDNLLISLSA